jgi:acetyl esterase/lipase
VVIRAVLAAVALVVLLFPGLVVLGGFAPQLPFVARFGAFIAEDLPWIGLAALVAVALAAIAVRLGGGLPARVVLLLSLLTFGGALVIAAVLYGFAGQQGASYSILRQATTWSSALPSGPVMDSELFATVDGRDLRADIYWPGGQVPVGGSTTPGTRPSVVFVHGGAFVGGGLGSRPALFEFLANEGYTVVDIEYRLAPPPRWADAPSDVLCALVWLGESAPRFGLDPAQLFLMGESAGASLALVAGYAAGETGASGAAIEPSCVGEPLVPAGIIAISPAADLAGIWEDGTLVAAGLRFPEAYIGGTPTEFPDRYEAASPFAYVRTGMPPTLIIGGANDHLVLPNRVTGLYDRLRQAGVDVRLVMVPFAEHGFDGFPNGYGEQLEESIIPAFIRDVTR